MIRIMIRITYTQSSTVVDGNFPEHWRLASNEYTTVFASNVPQCLKKIACDLKQTKLLPLAYEICISKLLTHQRVKLTGDVRHPTTQRTSCRSHQAQVKVASTWVMVAHEWREPCRCET
jgi:hypothetical protein